MVEDPSQDWNLDAVAKMAGVGKFHVARAFKKSTGLTPHRYLLALRVSRAKRLMREGWTPAAVAGEVGFADQSHLTRVFSSVAGITPGQYFASSRVGSK